MPTQNGALRAEPRFRTLDGQLVSSWAVQRARVVLGLVDWTTIEVFLSEGDVYKRFPGLLPDEDASLPEFQPEPFYTTREGGGHVEDTMRNPLPRVSLEEARNR